MLSKMFLMKFTSNQFFVDLVRVSLYPAEFISTLLSTRTNSVIEYIKNFLIDLNKKLQKEANNIPNSKQIKKNIEIISSILSIRERGPIINFNNIKQHLSLDDLSVSQLINSANSQKIEDEETFRKVLDNILVTIQAFYEIDAINPVLKQIGDFVEYCEDKPIFEAIKNYKDIINRAYSDLTKLSTLLKMESAADYFLISDSNSVQSLAENVTNYIAKGYSYLRSGYSLIDDSIGGLESATFHLIMAPSNHAKSIFMVNLCRNVIEKNLNDFDYNDTILFITLEDDIYKLVRRFISIFGNYNYNTLRELFRISYEISRTYPNSAAKLKSIFSKLLENSILQVTKGKVNLLIKHSSENTFSAGDLEKFLDQLKVNGKIPKLVFLDYIDVMVPTVNLSNYRNSDYDAQGQIVHELRVLSRNYKIPIISISQNRRESEKETIEMTNELVGDSYKKVRYSDNIYMLRKRTGLNFLSEPVKRDILSNDFYDLDNPNQLSADLLKYQDILNEKLTPIEIKITKSKDSERGTTKFLLFCSDNLRIYNKLRSYFDDCKTCEFNSKNLSKEISDLKNELVYCADSLLDF